MNVRSGSVPPAKAAGRALVSPEERHAFRFQRVDRAGRAAAAQESDADRPYQFSNRGQYKVKAKYRKKPHCPPAPLFETRPVLHPPVLSAHLPGTGGTIKNSPADFIVVEEPLYEPCGDGEHVYVRITREDRNTRDLVKDLARIFSMTDKGIGTAGLKDRHARTTQTFSLHLHTADPDDVALRIESELGVAVEEVNRHRNKLKTGHLRGNRFDILVREVAPDAVERLQRKQAFFAGRRLPNYYGEQRFGAEGDNAERGRDLVLGRGKRPSRWLAKFLLSAYQSDLFNQWLALRIERELFTDILAGDVARKTESGGIFVVEDAETDRPRFLAHEIDFTGPLYGSKMRRPAGQPAELEDAILDPASDEGRALFRHRELDGSRRAAGIAFDELELSHAVVDDGLRFRFSLRPGSYATVVLREFMNPV